jgi:protein involved in polysaccharide export with SLBB domain
MRPGDTLIDAIAYAGGFSSRCDIKHIIIINRSNIKIVNLKSYLKGEGQLPETDLTIYDGDLIIVPEVLRPDYAKAMFIVNGIVQSLIIRTGGGSSPST